MSRRRMFVNTHAPELDLKDDDFTVNLEAFLYDLRVRDRSEHTLEYYRVNLRQFMHILEDQRYSTRLRDITDDMIREGFIAYMYDVRKVQHASVATALRAIRAFLNWAVQRRVITKSPMNDITIGDPKPPTIETFTREQIRDLLAQPDPKLFVGIRDIAIIILFLETGVRVRELCDIELEHVRLNDSQILIKGKNGEDRLVPLQTQSKRILKRYIEARGASPVDWLFLSVDDKQMNRDSVRRRIEKYGRTANITNVRCSPHTFRHTFAKMAVQNGADIFSLQRILGHKTLDMVRRYVNMFSGDVQKAHERFSPVENLRLRF